MDKKYTKIGLKDAWNSFMEDEVKTAMARAETSLDYWLKYMDGAWNDGDENSDANTGSDMDSKESRLAKLKQERGGL